MTARFGNAKGPANFGRVKDSIMRNARQGNKDAFIFDLDGVLGNSRKANLENVMAVLDRYGFKPRFVNGNLEAICSRHSPDTIFRMLVPGLENEPETRKRMITELTALSIQNTHLILPTPLVDTLPELKGEFKSRLAVATNRKESAEPAIVHIRAMPHLDTYVTSLEAPEKPDKAMIEIAMARMGAKPARTLFIGDNMEDLLAGMAAGVETYLVQWQNI